MKRVLILFVVLLLLLAGCADDTSEKVTVKSRPGAQQIVEIVDESSADEDSDSEVEVAYSKPSTTTGAAGVIRDFKFSLPLFSADSPWNQKATGARVLEDSDKQILVFYRVMIGDDSEISSGSYSPGWAMMDINYDHYSIPISRASDTMVSVPLCNYDGELDYTNPKVLPDTWYDEGGPVSAPKPAGKIRPSGPQGTDADGHVVLFNTKTNMEYDFWQVTTVGNGKCSSRGGGYEGTDILEAGIMDFFDVSGKGANPAGNEYSSARASGLPLLGGLILPEDVESGSIDHALACAIPAPRLLNGDDIVEGVDYVYPASRAEETYYNTNKYAIAQGQRLRLRQTLRDEDGNVIDENSLAPITLMFLKALREYGCYVADNAGGFSFSAEDVHTAPFDVTDAEVNRLIGASSGAALPRGKSKWEIVLSKLGDELEYIPIAEGAGEENPRKAAIVYSNFDVVESARK
jgi:hypothetical protein